MLLTEIISMLNLLRELAGRKAQLDQDYFDNFINPIWLCFLEIHKDYKDSYARYTDMVMDDTKSAEYILDEIRTDSIDTEDLRTNIEKMARYLPCSVPSCIPNDMIQEFLSSILMYFDASTGFKIYGIENNQREKDITLEYALHNKRYSAIIHISRQGSNFDRQEAKEMFDDIARIVQRGYKIVADRYYAIKEKIKTG